MYCPRCGQLHDEKAKFCSACGTALNLPSPAPAANERLVRAYKLLIPSIGMCSIFTVMLPIFSFVIAPLLGDQYDGHWFLEGGGMSAIITGMLAVVNFKIQYHIYHYAKSMGITLHEEMGKD